MSKGYFDNLRPGERRLVVVVGVAFFIVIQFWFVFPKFGDWDRVQARMWEAQEKLKEYEAEIDKVPKYKSVVQRMEKDGQVVGAEEQSTQFARGIQTHQARSGVNVMSTSKMQTTTNQFFIEVSQSISLQSKEDQLVNFLHGLGGGDSLIRVRDLSLRPDPSRQQLTANVKLIASFQKKPAVKGGPGGTGKGQAISTAKR
jgi:Tfp pilus assembly protein PilO